MFDPEPDGLLYPWDRIGIPGGPPLVPSFVAHEDGWMGALYAMHPGLGPELVGTCRHQHYSMHKAARCVADTLEIVAAEMCESELRALWGDR